MLFKHNDLGVEVWVRLDETAGVYEVFADAQAREYIGCGWTFGEARRVGLEWIRELEETQS